MTRTHEVERRAGTPVGRLLPVLGDYRRAWLSGDVVAGLTLAAVAMRREYHPKDIVLSRVDEHWKARPADPGAETEPGLIIYRFEAELFFANADYFAARLQDLVSNAPHPVRWVVLDLVSLDDIDYTGGLLLASTVSRLQQAGITIALAETDAVRGDLERYGITQRVGASCIFDTVQAAVAAFHTAAGRASPRAAPAA